MRLRLSVVGPEAPARVDLLKVPVLLLLEDCVDRVDDRAIAEVTRPAYRARPSRPGDRTTVARALRQAPSLPWTNELDRPGILVGDPLRRRARDPPRQRAFRARTERCSEADRWRSGAAGGLMLAFGPPRYTTLRAALAPCFAPAALRRLEGPQAQRSCSGSPLSLRPLASKKRSS